MPVTCLVVGCGSRSNRDKVGFYSVPTVLNHRFVTDNNELSRKRRTLWLGAISRNDLTDAKIKNQRVCSKHFTTGKPASLYDENHPDWVPSQDMGHVSQNVLKQPDDVARKERVGKRRALQVSKRVPLWNKEYLIILINTFKKHPCLHGNESATASLGKRNAAYDKITKEINDISGKLFTVEDVKKKILMLKNQYRFELRKMKRVVPATTKSNLWYFEMLDFLGKNKCAKSSLPDEESLNNQRSNGVIVETTSPLETDNWQHIKEETDTEHDEEYGKANLSETTERNIMDYDDIYDTIGKNVAHKLREMSDDQRIFAERLINEIVYHGMMGNLNENSKLCLREIE